MPDAPGQPHNAQPPPRAARGRPQAALWRYLLASVVSGLLVYLSYPPVNAGPLAFVAFVPLMVAAAGVRGYGPAVLCGLLAGLTACVPAFAWVRSVATSGWLALSLYVALYTVVAAVAFRYFQHRFGAWWPLLGAIVWVGLEVARAHLGPGFPWLFIGYTQYRFLPLVQSAALGGVYAVSFLVLLINGALAGLATPEVRMTRKLVMLAASALLLGGSVLGGWAAMAHLELQDGPVVGVVQQNVPRLVAEIFAQKTDEQIVGEMSAELEKAVGLTRNLQGSGVRLVLWPETTVQVPLNVPAAQPYQSYAEKSAAELRRICGLLNAYMLVGAPTYVAPQRPGERPSHYGTDVTGFANSALYLSPQGRLVDTYSKIRLVPFGEYIPLRRWFPFLQTFTPMTRDIVPGTRQTLFELPPREGGEPVQFGALICYEDVFAGLCADFRRQGADFLVNLTDEGWYDIPGELGQHLAMAVFRAVETRTTVVRAANTGISCFIDPRGNIYARLEHHTAGSLSARLRLCPQMTPYVRLGDAFGIVCLMLAMILPPLLAAASPKAS
jgi:apolipoprotein N-acyltransferase